MVGRRDKAVASGRRGEAVVAGRRAGGWSGSTCASEPKEYFSRASLLSGATHSPTTKLSSVVLRGVVAPEPRRGVCLSMEVVAAQFKPSGGGCSSV